MSWYRNKTAAHWQMPGMAVTPIPTTQVPAIQLPVPVAIAAVTPGPAFSSLLVAIVWVNDTLPVNFTQLRLLHEGLHEQTAHESCPDCRNIPARVTAG